MLYAHSADALHLGPTRAPRLVEEGGGQVLTEQSKVEQRYVAVMGVIKDGLAVTEVAEKFGVTRQSVHTWLRRYEAAGSKRSKTARTGCEASPTGSTVAPRREYPSSDGTRERQIVSRTRRLYRWV
jgi:transposase-like protein